RVDDQQRHAALTGVSLVVVDLLDEQALAERLPGKRTPAGALNGARRLCELLLEGVERAEVLVDRRREVAVRAVTAVRREVLPEDRVQDVSREVERKRLLETDDRAELVVLAGCGELFERRVDAVDVRLVMLVVVQLEQAGLIMRFERGVVVAERG